MPKQQKKRVQRVKSVIKAVGGGKRARRGASKAIKAGRKLAKGDTKGAARGAAGALKQAAKSKMGREQRRKFFG